MPGVEKETEVLDETSKADPSQEDTKDSKEAKADTKESEEKVEKKEPNEEEAPEVELKGIEKLADGRVKFTIGGGVYFGKDVEEAVANAEAGITEKNKSYQKTQEELRKLKAQTSIREVDEEDDEKDIPPAPQAEKYLREVFTERGLDIKMLSYTEAQWDEHQDEKRMRDRHIVKLQGDIEAAKAEATRRYYQDETKWYNLSLMKKEITPAVREMVADSGLEPDEFGEVYAALLKDPQMRSQNGELNATAILRSMSKKIVEKLRAQGASTGDLAEAKKRLKEELDEKKKILQDGSSRTNEKPRKQTKPVKDLNDAFDPERWNKVLAES